MHYFITSHFNYCNYESRDRLTREFLERYPYVIPLEGSYDEKFIFNGEKYNLLNPGWATNYMINEFIKKYYKSIDSITFIDADIVLFEDFFKKVKEMHALNVHSPFFIQPFSKVTRDNAHSTSFIGELITTGSLSGHTGYCWSMNRHLIDKIECLPTGLLLGGFDTFLMLAITRNSKVYNKLLCRLENLKITTELINFYNKCEGVNYKYIKGSIKTFDHGLLTNRKYNERFEMYRNLNIEKIINYFRCRNE